MVYGTHRPPPVPIEGMVQCAVLDLTVQRPMWPVDSWDMSQAVKGKPTWLWQQGSHTHLHCLHVASLVHTCSWHFGNHSFGNTLVECTDCLLRQCYHWYVVVLRKCITHRLNDTCGCYRLQTLSNFTAIYKHLCMCWWFQPAWVFTRSWLSSKTCRSSEVFPSRPHYLSGLICSGTESSLLECAYDSPLGAACSSGQGVHVTCTAHSHTDESEDKSAYTYSTRNS